MGKRSMWLVDMEMNNGAQKTLASIRDCWAQ